VWILALTGTLALAASASAASVTITANVAGLPFTVDGKPYRAPATIECAPGSTHTVGFEAITNGATGTRYQFLKWTDSGEPYTRTITAGSTNAAYTAIFTTQYLVIALAKPSLAGTVRGVGWFDAGVTATIEAIPAAGFRFASFSGDLTGTTNPAALPVTCPLNIAAHFAGQPIPAAAGF
jgi:hypothetical protein